MEKKEEMWDTRRERSRDGTESADMEAERVLGRGDTSVWLSLGSQEGESWENENKLSFNNILEESVG